jgi:hypothetical protein
VYGDDEIETLEKLAELMMRSRESCARYAIPFGEGKSNVAFLSVWVDGTENIEKCTFLSGYFLLFY